MATRKEDDVFTGPFIDDEERELIESIENAWAELPPPPPPSPAELERMRAFWRQVWVDTMRARSAAEETADQNTNRT